MTTIAEALAEDFEVVVISGWPGSAATSTVVNPKIVELANRAAPKNDLVHRTFAMALFGLRAFVRVTRLARRNDIVIAVTTPFILPYFIALAARLRGASSVLILYDLYPEVLIMAGVVGAKSTVVRAIRYMSGIMFGWLDAIVTIGKDFAPHILQYRRLTREKIVLIPNWATLTAGFRPLDINNRYRHSLPAGGFVAGMFGNLGFTHDPETVFEAARRIGDKANIHFLISGSGVGWQRLKALQAEFNLAHVTLFERVADEDLEDFLSAGDLWIIPYRRNPTAISSPSRLYNILAAGRPAIVLTELEAEHAQILLADDIGWVVRPGDFIVLAETIVAAANDKIATTAKGRRAADIAATRYTREGSLQAYRQLAHRLVRQRGLNLAKFG